jgi:DNA mismatch repair ATPase MutS
MKISELNEKLKDISNQEKKLERKFNGISILRILIFVSIILSLSYAYYEDKSIMYLVGFLLLMSFIYLINIHNSINEEKKYNSSYKEIIKKYIDRFNDDWQNFKEKGEDFIIKDKPLEKDLDLLGKSSLYQYICTANTQYGKKILHDYLTNNNPQIRTIMKRQSGVRELYSKKDFSIHFQTLSNLITDDEKNSNNNLDNLKKNISNKYFNYFVFVTPIIVSGLLILALLNMVNITLPIILVFFQLVISFIGYRKNTQILNKTFYLQKNIKHLNRIFVAIENESFESEYLIAIQKCVISKGGASKSILKLGFIAECVNMRHNQIFNIILASLFLWDYQCVIMLNNWQAEYGDEIINWLKSVGEFEALISLSVICNVKDNYCFPVIDEDNTTTFKAENIVHPLVREDIVVSNSFELDGQTCIITGSNMSGKTTFLRNMGVNLILAYAGGPVCGKYFKTSCMKIFTSMRIQDNVSEGISTFYAEILRIKQMVTYSENKTPMICLIDEIFKGTNSADRIMGATEIIKKLSKPWIITLVSTHDFELCDLENEKEIDAVNYHFSEYYDNNKLYFDYKIKRGKCDSTNAKYLLKMAGLM